MSLGLRRLRPSNHRGNRPTTAQVWFRKMKRDFKPMSPESEASLAASIKRGREAQKELAELEKKNSSENERIKELKDVTREGEKARENLILHNVMFAAWVVNKSEISCIRERAGVELMDLVQEANTALVEAVDNFDPDYGVRFSNYAYLSIRGRILKHLKKNKDINVPAQVFRWLNASEDAFKFIEQHDEPSEKEKAELEKRHKKAFELVERMLEGEEELMKIEQRREKLRNSLRVASSVMSLNEKLIDGGLPLEEMVGTGSEADVVGMMFLKSAGDLVAEDTDVLSRLEKQVLFSFYWEEVSLAKMGRKMGLSRERMRQIRDNAIEKLRFIARERGFAEDYGETIPGTEKRGRRNGGRAHRTNKYTRKEDKIAFLEKHGVPRELYSSWNISVVPMNLLKETIPAAEKEGLLEFLHLCRNVIGRYYKGGADAILRRVRKIRDSSQKTGTNTL